MGADGLRAVSGDGMTWIDEVVDGTDLRGIAHHEDLFVTVGLEHAYTSQDGTNWADGGDLLVNAWDVAGGSSGWVAVGESGAIWTSPDGSEWTAVADDSLDLVAVAFGGDVSD